MSYFLVKHNSVEFNDLTLVKKESVSYSGNCYLVSDLNDNYKREWIMYYDLYKMINKNEETCLWNYDENYNNIMKELISKL